MPYSGNSWQQLVVGLFEIGMGANGHSHSRCRPSRSLLAFFTFGPGLCSAFTLRALATSASVQNITTSSPCG
jgi:hypothetical protein